MQQVCQAFSPLTYWWSSVQLLASKEQLSSERESYMGQQQLSCVKGSEGRKVKKEKKEATSVQQQQPSVLILSWFCQPLPPTVGATCQNLDQHDDQHCYLLKGSHIIHPGILRVLCWMFSHFRFLSLGQHSEGNWISAGWTSKSHHFWRNSAFQHPKAE